MESFGMVITYSLEWSKVRVDSKLCQQGHLPVQLVITDVMTVVVVVVGRVCVIIDLVEVEGSVVEVDIVQVTVAVLLPSHQDLIMASNRPPSVLGTGL